MIKEKDNFKTIFEDNEIIIINKPAGLLTIPDRYNHSLQSVYQILKEKYGNIFIVHRLDVGTSGILLFAKTAHSHSFISNQFASHSVKKLYTAILEGVFPQDEQIIDIPLMQNAAKKNGVIPSARGKNSTTILKVIERFKKATLVEAELKTGRLHQLRAHTSAIGYPLLVDDFYGNSAKFFVSSLKRKFNLKKNEVELPIISRPTMHATELQFLHLNGEKMTFTAAFPKDFTALIQVLQKYSKI